MITLHQCEELKSFVDGLVEDFKNETWKDNPHRKETLAKMINIMYGRKATPNKGNRTKQKYKQEN